MMAGFRKWTAMVAFVVIVALILGLLALVPIHEFRRGGAAGTVWPLSHSFGHHHVLAVVEVFIGWLAVCIGVIVGIVFGLYTMLHKAGW